MATINIPQIRFKGFEGEWEKKILGEVVTICSMKRVHQSDWTTSGIRFFRARDVVAAFKNEEIEPIFISEEKYREYSSLCGKVSIGDLLVTGVGTIGVPYLIKDSNPIYIKDGNIIWMKNNGSFNGEFLYHCFCGNKVQQFIKETAGTGTVGTYTIANGKKTPIDFTSLPEQNKIASLFTSLDKQISVSEAKLDKLRTIKKTLLKKMFAASGENIPQIRFKGFDGAWEEKRLGEIGVVSMCKRIFKWQTSSTGDIPFYKIGTFGQNADSFIDIKLYKEYKNLYPYPNKGDILISAAGTIGRTVVYYGEEAYFQDSNIVWLNHNEEIVSNKFLYHLYNIIQWYGIEGSTIKRLYNNNILNTKSRIPSHTEQKKLASFFTSLDKQISLQEQKTEKLKAIKKTLLKKMFV